MNTIYENICTYSYANIKEMKKATMKKYFKIFALVTAVVLLFLGLVLQASQVLSRNAGFIFLVGSGYFCWLYFTFCARNAKRIYKHNRELYNEDVQSKLQFKDREIVANNFQTGAEAKFDYDKVESVIETKNLFLLIVENHMTMMLDKAGFTDNCKEKPDYFRRFLADRIEEEKLHFIKFEF